MSVSRFCVVSPLGVHAGGGVQPRVQPGLHDPQRQQPRREAGDVPGASDTAGAGSLPGTPGPSLPRSQGECHE